jgi:hypothetical protein
MGSIDQVYGKIIESTCAVMFLATPHQGADLAALLNPVLKYMLPGKSSKRFISDMKKGSSTLYELNDQFRHLSKKLVIFSFYETVKTKFLKLEKVSQIYPRSNTYLRS